MKHNSYFIQHVSAFAKENLNNLFASVVFIVNFNNFRNLDFSKNGDSISESDIKQYFNNEIACKHILRVNVRNLYHINPRPLLYIYIGKALNLVDIDINQSEAVKDIWLLASFLSTKIHLKRLAIHWGITEKDAPLCRRVLEEPFRRLTRLSVKVKIDFMENLFPSLESCQELRKLYMCVTADYYEAYSETYWDTLSKRYKKLSNLEVFGITGREWSGEVMKILTTMLPDPEKWTDFQMGIRDKVNVETSNRDEIDYDQMDYDYYLGMYAYVFTDPPRLSLSNILIELTQFGKSTVAKIS